MIPNVLRRLFNEEYSLSPILYHIWERVQDGFEIAALAVEGRIGSKSALDKTKFIGSFGSVFR
jgi:hypothetical protein